MLNGETVVTAVVAALRDNADLMALMIDPAKIIEFQFFYGASGPLSQAVFELHSLDILVCYAAEEAGSWANMVLAVHRIEIYFRSPNVQSGIRIGPVGLWALIKNGALQSDEGLRNIRNVNLLPELDLMNYPTMSRRDDGAGGDLFVGVFKFPELNTN